MLVSAHVMSLQRVWSFRSGRAFSRVLVGTGLLVTLAATCWVARAGVVAAAVVFVTGLVMLPFLGYQHRLRHLIGSAGRGDDLLLWLETHGGEYDFTRRSVAESAFDAGRVLWRAGVDADATVADAVRRGPDGCFAFVAHHDAVEQFVVVPTAYLPTVTIDESRDPELIRTRIAGHTIQTDDVQFASLFADAAALAHIETTGLGRVTLADGFLISRSPRFVDASGLDQRIRDLRQLMRALPKGTVRRFSREQELVTRLRASV